MSYQPESSPPPTVERGAGSPPSLLLKSHPRWLPTRHSHSFPPIDPEYLTSSRLHRVRRGYHRGLSEVIAQKGVSAARVCMNFLAMGFLAAIASIAPVNRPALLRTPASSGLTALLVRLRLRLHLGAEWNLLTSFHFEAGRHARSTTDRQSKGTGQ